MNWFPLLNYTHYSLQFGFSKPKELAKKCRENSYPACGIADYKSISGAVSFYQACIANDVKPIIGCSFDNFALFAKNKDGWLELIQIVSSIEPNGAYDKALMIKLCKNGNLICVASEELSSPIKGDNLYIWSESFTKTFYTNKDQAQLHRILLCSKLKTTLSEIKKKGVPEENAEWSKFFESNDFYLKDRTEVSQLVVRDPRLDDLEDIFNKCENYNILNRPMLPTFETPNGETEKEYLRTLSRRGWKDLLGDTVTSEEERKIYGDRFRKEFETFEKANLFGYFLIVWDILNWCREQGWMVGPGRGSAAGCLISYLIGITQIDPIEFDLLFERFFNIGRSTPDSISFNELGYDDFVENVYNK